MNYGKNTATGGNKKKATTRSKAAATKAKAAKRPGMKK